MNHRNKLRALMALVAGACLTFATGANAQPANVIKLGWTTSEGPEGP